MAGVQGPALGLGFFPASAPGEVGGAWLDADFSKGRYRFAARALASEAQFRAVSGVIAPAAGHLVFGPYVSPDAPELLSDGSFASGSATDWTSVGSSIAVASGALRVTAGGGNGSGAYRTIAGLIDSAGRAYRLSADVWRETASNVCLGFGAGGGSTASYSQTANLTGTMPAPSTLYCGGFNPTTASIALRHLVNPSTGIYWTDNLPCVRRCPMRGSSRVISAG